MQPRERKIGLGLNTSPRQHPHPAHPCRGAGRAKQLALIDARPATHRQRTALAGTRSRSASTMASSSARLTAPAPARPPPDLAYAAGTSTAPGATYANANQEDTVDRPSSEASATLTPALALALIAAAIGSAAPAGAAQTKPTIVLMHGGWADEQRPATQQAFAEPSESPAWRSIRSWYLLGREERAIPPAAQRFMARRAGAKITSLRSSHASPLSHPKAATRLILRAAAHIR
jgi:hypothetical protein